MTNPNKLYAYNNHFWSIRASVYNYFTCFYFLIQKNYEPIFFFSLSIQENIEILHLFEVRVLTTFPVTNTLDSETSDKCYCKCPKRHNLKKFYLSYEYQKENFNSNKWRSFYSF